MSTVLIGVIGVVLFIGLALAAVLVLGSDFTSASASARAATVSSTLQQVSQAAEMYQTRHGVTLMGSDGSTLLATLVAAHSLKSTPQNAINPGVLPVGSDINGSQSAALPMRLVYMDLGATKVAHDACLEIERASGASDADQVVNTPTYFDQRSNADQRQGCMSDIYQANHYVAYTIL